MLVFSIETSCDETSVCIMDNNKVIHSHIIFSQEIHKHYGGVVPELASRAHLEIVQKITKQAFDRSKKKISDIDVLSVTNSQRLLSAVDGALRRIDAERGDLGATMNRMEHTIDNLSNIVMNTKVARGRKQDADMAAESIELSKSRILQQAATSMLSQANKTMQSVLELLS